MSRFIDLAARLVERGASSAEVIEAVYNERKHTGLKFGKRGFPGDTLSSVIIVDGGIIDLGSDLATIRQSGSAKAARAKQAAYDQASALIKKCRRPAETADVLVGLALPDELTGDDATAIFDGEQAQKIHKAIDLYFEDYNQEPTFYNAKFVEEASNPTAARFMYQALKYFDYVTQGGKKPTQDAAKKDKRVPFSPLVPVVATIILAKNLFPQQDNDQANAVGNAVEKFLTPYIAAFIDQKKVGSQIPDKSLGEDDSASLGVLVTDAVKLVDRLLAAAEKNDEIAAATEEKDATTNAVTKTKRDARIAIRREAAKNAAQVSGWYLTDLAIYRQLTEETLNADHTAGSIDAQSAAGLSYVAYAGQVYPVFSKNYPSTGLVNSIEDRYGANFATLFAFGEDQGQSIWQTISAQIENESEENPNAADLHTAINTILQIKYSGLEGEDAEQLVYAMLDLYSESQSYFQDDLAQLRESVIKEYVGQVKAKLADVRDHVMPTVERDFAAVEAAAPEDLPLMDSVWHPIDKDAIDRIKAGLATLTLADPVAAADDVVPPPTPAPAPAPATRVADPAVARQRRARKGAAEGFADEQARIVTSRRYKYTDASTTSIRTVKMTDQQQSAVSVAINNALLRSGVKKLIERVVREGDISTLTKHQQDLLEKLPTQLQYAIEAIAETPQVEEGEKPKTVGAKYGRGIAHEVTADLLRGTDENPEA